MNCPNCKNEFSGNFCPHCGTPANSVPNNYPTSMPPVPKKKGVVLKVILIVIAVLVGLSIFGNLVTPSAPTSTHPSSATAPSSSKPAPNSPSAQPKPAEQQTSNIGQAATIKGVTVTLLGITESTGSQYNRPADGNVFVFCEFLIENNSKAEIAISSMMSFDAYFDDFATTVSLAALIDKGSATQLDGTVAAGKKLKGVVAYEVPSDWKTVEIGVQPDLFGGKVIFKAQK